MSSSHVALSVVGGMFDVAGGLLVASEQIAPRAKRARESVRRAQRDIRLRLGLLKRVANKAGAGIEMAGGIAPSGNLGTLKIFGVGASTDEKLAYLLEHVGQTDTRLSAVEEQAQRFPSIVETEVARSRNAITEQFASELAAARDLYIRARLVGIILLAIGGVVQAAANIVP